MLLEHNTFIYPATSVDDPELKDLNSSKLEDNYKPTERKSEIKLLLDDYYNKQNNVNTFNSVYDKVDPINPKDIKVIDKLSDQDTIVTTKQNNDNTTTTTIITQNKPKSRKIIVPDPITTEKPMEGSPLSPNRVKDDVDVLENTMLDSNTINYNKFHQEIEGYSEQHNYLQYILALLIVVVGIGLIFIFL